MASPLISKFNNCVQCFSSFLVLRQHAVNHYIRPAMDLRNHSGNNSPSCYRVG